MELGLSKKTNVAMTSAGCFAAVGTVGVAVNWIVGIVAISAACIVALYAIGCQYKIDKKK